MKKIVFLILAFLTGFGAFAYNRYGYDSSSGSDDLGLWIFMLAYLILTIIFIIRWWKMTVDVKAIRQLLAPTTTLTYLIAIGEREQAQKNAVKMLVDLLFPIYNNKFVNNSEKPHLMDAAIANKLPRIKRLGLHVPDYVTCGEKFIAYINELTGWDVPPYRY